MTIGDGSVAAGIFGELKKRWKWLLGFGALSVGLGIAGLGIAVFLTLASVTFYGIILLVDGGLQFVQSFQSAGWKAKLWQIIISLLYVAGGIFVVRNPVLASSILTLFLAGAITAIGVSRIIMAFQMKGTPGWFLILIGGGGALVLGILIFARWPGSSLVVIGTFISIELIINGWSAITVALAARQVAKES
jgi:uncharacterized membrane protein HdeD (DUF308 family)